MFNRRSSWLGQLVGACFGVLAGATALYFAVHLLLSIRGPLIAIGCVVSAIWLVWIVARRRRSGW